MYNRCAKGKNIYTAKTAADISYSVSALLKKWQVHFLKDYMELLHGTKPSLYPMIESAICSRARVFSGTFKSTLSGYVHRLR